MTQRFRDILMISYPVFAAWAALAGITVTNPAWAGSSSTNSGNSVDSSILLETFRTHSRLSFRVDDGVTSELKSTPQGFELYLKGIGLADLGAPLGEEARWANRFKRMQDPRLDRLDFAEVAGGLRIQGVWKYGHGPDAPANPMMESFDYRERNHSALVMDFWVKEGPTLGQVKATQAVTRRIASVKKHEDDEKARAARRLAREKARILAEDPKLFCGTPLSDRSDVFLQFLPVHEPVYFSRWFSEVAPDADYAYYTPQSKDHDAQYVRLALKLYREGNFALANRTIDFFDQEYPESNFRSEMRFLRANAFLKLGLTEEGMQLLREIRREPKASQVALHAGMFLALKQLAAKDYLGALESFSALSDHQAENRLAWVFHLGAAECARALRQTDRAAKEYQWVAEHAPDRSSQAEGAFRIGDLYMDRFQYDQGLAAYSIALRHFEKESAQFPSVHINRADALYGLGQHPRAAQAYHEFLDRFSSHPAGWRAAYRMGEIAARAESSTRESKEALGWYLETINRFPFSPGATLARLQLLPCGTHGGFSPDSADRFFAADAEKFDGAGEVYLERYKDFRALSRVRSLMTMGKQEEAVATAIAELRRVPRAEARRWLGHLLVFNFRKSVLELLESGQKLEALTFYQKNAETVPLSDGTVDPGYMMALSQAASDLGLGKLAQEVNGVFEKARKSHETAGRELASDSGSPGDSASSGDSYTKLEASERAFTEAKALWIGNGMKAADTIRARLGQVAPESRFSYERELILGLIEEKKGDVRAALRHAAQAQLLGPRNIRVDAWVASLEARGGDAQAALATYRALESAPRAVENSLVASTAELMGVAPAPTTEAMMLAQSEILEKGGHWGESAANYSRAVDQGMGGAEARYGYARALLRTGLRENHSKAIAALEKLAAEDALPNGAGAGRGPATAAGVGTAGAGGSAASGATSAQGVAGGTGAEAGATPAAVASGGPGAAASGAASGANGAANGAADNSGSEADKTARAQQDKFWRKLASETLANEKSKNGAKEGMKQ